MMIYDLFPPLTFFNPQQEICHEVGAGPVPARLPGRANLFMGKCTKQRSQTFALMGNRAGTGPAPTLQTIL